MDSPPSTTRLRAGLIGTGAIASAHARAIERSGQGRLVAVADLDPSRAAAFAATLATSPEAPRVAADIEGLIDAGLDVLHICTPPGAHLDQAIAALQAGVHVVVEKPPALSLDELGRMTDAARAAGRELAVVFQQRTGSAAAHVRALIRSGAVGRPLIATCETMWFRPQSYFDVPWRGSWESEGGGTTLGHGIHQIDLLAWLVGDWESVHARLWRVGRETALEDASTAFVTFANGLVATVTTSAVSPHQVSRIRIDTELATITVEHLYGHGHDDWRITPAPHVDARDVEAWALPDEEESSGHDPFLRDVYASLRTGAAMPAVATDPMLGLELVSAIYASAEHERAMTPDDLRADARFRRSLRSAVVDRRPRR